MAAKRRAANPEREREYQRKYRDANREKLNERAKERQAKYRAEHPERDREACKRWRQNHPERHKARQERWEAQNRERMRPHRTKKQAERRAADREHERELAAAWRQKNRDKCIVYREKRRALKASAPGAGVSRAEWAEIRDGARGVCPYCGKQAKLTMDHVVPLVSDGAHDPSNIAAVCRTCNQSKGKKSLVVWLATRLAA